ncbi:hypothetical protein [Methylocaldum sp.]|uniref:hypothetical protein n=1 Tax=Methylocaldum sp. TaxID=1969727 RepID=UPI002D4E8D11|nr:hypothetical protein [Methylocaldum sp.]HYE38248.1 hypothetical protein [Methylocaldum sp.]
MSEKQAKGSAHDADSLEALIERARHHVMTPAERRDQMVSFVYGMLDSKDTRSKDDIRATLAKHYGWD